MKSEIKGAKSRYHSRRPPQQPDAAGYMHIRVKEETYLSLYAMRGPWETFSDVVTRAVKRMEEERDE